MKVLLLEIPSADHAYEGWLSGKAIKEIFDLLNIENTYKLILSRRFLIKSIKDVSEYDVVHIECHSDEEGIYYSPSVKKALSWVEFANILKRTNHLNKKQLVISGCLAGNIKSKAKILAKREKGFKRVFAFDEEIEYDKAVAVWSGLYYLLSKAKKWNADQVRNSVQKLRECYAVNLLYFYPNRKTGEVSVYPKT